MTEWFQERPHDSHRSVFELESHVITAYYTVVPNGRSNGPDILSREDYLSAHGTHVDNTLPLRLLIKSDILIRELQRISKVRLDQEPLILIPPYKILIHHWDTIQRSLQTLKEARFAEAAKLDDAKEWEIKSRIDHLQCLHDFVQTDLAHLIGLRLKAREATLDYVSFDEVYHLFSPGDLLMGSNSGQDQLYQVYAVTGGRMRTKWPDSLYEFSDSMETIKGAHSARGFTNVRLSCYIMAWDGNRIGPIHFVHEIQHFVGRRRITELPAYPLRFLKNPSEVQNALRIRGQNVVECSGHRRYSAPSCQPLWPIEVFVVGTRYNQNSAKSWNEISKDLANKEVTHDVDGDVYIDYQSRYHFTFEIDPQISRLHDSLDEHPVPIYDSDTTTVDLHVDERLTDQFILLNQDITRVRKTSGDLDEDGARLQLLSSYVPGYEFRSRCWGKFSVSFPCNVQYRERYPCIHDAKPKSYSVVGRAKHTADRIFT